MSPGGGGGSSGRIKYSSFVETGPSKSSTSSSSSTILNILVPFKNYCPSEPLIISRSSMQQQQSTSSPRHPHLQQLHSPSQIKEKLLQALDRDYHVVDMALALEAVSLLEKTAVTKEALETTRIGLLVNGMRKKTQNNSLARRAKDLLRRWRDMVSKPGENGTGGTGQGPGLTGMMMNHMKLAGMKTSVSSPALSEFDRLASSSPGLLRPVNSMVSVVTSPAFRGMVSSGTLGSPALPHMNRGSRGVQPYQPSHISPSNSVASNASTSPGLSFTMSQTHSNSSRPSTPSSVAKSKAISPGPGRPPSVFDSSPVSVAVTNNNQTRGIKRHRDNDEDTMTGFEFTGKRAVGLNGSGGTEWPWTDECSRDSNLSWSGDSSRLGNHTAGGVGASATGLDERSSSSKGRPIRKHGKPDSDVLKEKFASIARSSKVKTTQELLEDLARRSGSPNLTSRTELQVNHQLQQQQANLDSNKKEILAKYFQSTAASERVSSKASKVTKKTTSAPDPVAEIYARLPPLDPARVAALWPEEEESGVDIEDVEEEPKSPPNPATEEDVDLLHNGEVECVNGTRDCKGEFHPWHETVTVGSYSGDPLHLLPYVVIE